ncbi:MAG TPA: MBL fold metallo-hydrolase [Candidatus Saccharimonadales bacterium]|nr:MBL fold metallo-hydrolase [Candidatus Saccharimonadales bacterium]
MKITKYTQSCAVIEDSGARVLIDIYAADKDRLGEIDRVDAVLYTHEHGDHFDADMAKNFAEQGVPVYANASTAKQVDGKVNVVEDGQEFSVGDMKVKALELPHCLMVDGSTSVQNTGFLLNDRAFHPGDGINLEGLKAEILLTPIAGPDISPKDACDFARQVGAKESIPIHYDMMSAKPDFYANMAIRYNMPFRGHALAHGETIEL